MLETTPGRLLFPCKVHGERNGQIDMHGFIELRAASSTNHQFCGLRSGEVVVSYF